MSKLLALPPNTLLLQFTEVGIHIVRDCEKERNKEKENLLQLQILPLIEEIKRELRVPWIDHVFEPLADRSLEHIVLPEIVYYAFKDEFSACNFEVVPDQREFACRDGLKDALMHGADVGTKWH